MYTGIVQGVFPVAALERQPGLLSFALDLPDPLMEALTIGASVGVDGVCLTVTRFSDHRVWFDVMQQTLDLTTLGQLQVGTPVNVERSAKEGVEIGGHIVSGHVDGWAEVVAIESPENNHYITYRLPAEKLKYVFNKGFIALNGCSLTVARYDRQAGTITVCLIPETLRVTNHGLKQVGDRVNFEVDRSTQAIVDTVERVLQENPALLRQALEQSE